MAVNKQKTPDLENEQLPNYHFSVSINKENN